jgi:hypothetical protein
MDTEKVYKLIDDEVAELNAIAAKGTFQSEWIKSGIIVLRDLKRRIGEKLEEPGNQEGTRGLV